jgi:methyltransferase-like protein
MEEKKPKLKDTFTIEEKAGYITRESEAGIMLMDYNKGKIYEVNEVGSRIVKMCDGNHQIKDIQEAICKEYDVEREVMEKDMAEFFKKMEGYKTIDYV